MHSAFWLLVAVVAGWMTQMYFTYRQSMAFNDDVRRLRTSGRVSVGVAGKRYRGGRAYVAIAVDEAGIIRDALSLSGWTTFSRGKPLPALRGARINQICGNKPIPTLSRQLRDAARQAAEPIRSRVTS